MTPLRQRMLEDMGIRNRSPNTQLSYLQQVSSYSKQRCASNSSRHELGQVVVSRSADRAF